MIFLATLPVSCWITPYIALAKPKKAVISEKLPVLPQSPDGRFKAG